ncbi:amidohydrolase family protein [Sphingobium fuliginis]|uniref:Amidohydrolase n=1 Tax=Sphingobium fuliginis ATCC 27551 TaxID=1208342 RepID=A0A5B8CEB1_SPHSA|nr:amidohydrolase family protein [Sphingobium fuliginis]QDC37878.1 amidohydrolase [Sphingobium fuliginis ATCC 27551]
MTQLDRRTVIAGALAGPIISAEGARAQPSGTPLIATEEAYATPELMAALDAGPPGMTEAEKTYTALLRSGTGAGASELNRKLCSVEARLAEMDANGVDMHLLSITIPGPQAFPPKEGARVARSLNDGLAAIIRAHPTRFAGLAAIAPQDPQASVAEIERARKDLALNGVIINSHSFGEYLDEPKFRPILAALEAQDMPLYLHPRSPSQAMIGPYENYGLSGALWGYGADGSLHLLRMIFGGVFDEFPRLKVVLGHMGEGIPYYFTRIDNRYRNLMARGGEKLGLKPLRQLPSQYFKSNVYITTSGTFSHKVLAYCLDILGAERILFAIDYPYERSDEAVRFIRSAPLSPIDAEHICFRNAQTLFRIRNPALPKI